MKHRLQKNSWMWSAGWLKYGSLATSNYRLWLAVTDDHAFRDPQRVKHLDDIVSLTAELTLLAPRD